MFSEPRNNEEDVRFVRIKTQSNNNSIFTMTKLTARQKVDALAEAYLHNWETLAPQSPEWYERAEFLSSVVDPSDPDY